MCNEVACWRKVASWVLSVCLNSSYCVFVSLLSKAVANRRQPLSSISVIDVDYIRRFIIDISNICINTVATQYSFNIEYTCNWNVFNLVTFHCMQRSHNAVAAHFGGLENFLKSRRVKWITFIAFGVGVGGTIQRWQSNLLFRPNERLSDVLEWMTIIWTVWFSIQKYKKKSNTNTAMSKNVCISTCERQPYSIYTNIV